MKKIEVTTKEKTFYKIVTKIDKFAIVEENGQLGLIILHSGNFMVPFDDYVLDRDDDILIFTKKRDGEDDAVTIFDVKKRFHYGERKLVEKIRDGALILLNKFDGRMYFFCSKAYDDYNLHNLEFDSYTVGEMNGKYWILFNLGDKKGLFIEGRGMVLPLEQDDIRVIGDKIVFTKDGHTQINAGSIWSEEFDSIRLDPNVENLIYCRKGNETFVYYISRSLIPVFKTNSDSIELAYNEIYAYNFTGTLQFIVKENGHFIIREVIETYITDFKEGTIVTGPDKSYDKICFNGHLYIAQNNGKSELIHPYIGRKKNLLGTVQLGNNVFPCDGTFFYPNVPKNVNLTWLNEKSFIYSPDDGKELLISDNLGSNFFVWADKIEWLGENYYTVFDGEDKELYHYGHRLGSPLFISRVFIHGNDVSNTFEEGKRVWIILETTYGSFMLARVTHHNERPAQNFIWEHCKWAAFYPDFVLALDKEINLFSYDGTPLAILPPHITIDIVGHCNMSGKDATIYSIDGENYIIQDGEFINIPVKEKPLHMAVYEGEYGSVVINSNSKEDFSKKCAEIEKLNDEDFETVLQAQYNSSTEIQRKYPSLVLKPIQKN